jgi:hypothetical protein
MHEKPCISAVFREARWQLGGETPEENPARYPLECRKRRKTLRL